MPTYVKVVIRNRPMETLENIRSCEHILCKLSFICLQIYNAKYSLPQPRPEYGHMSIIKLCTNKVNGTCYYWYINLF